MAGGSGKTFRSSEAREQETQHWEREAPFLQLTGVDPAGLEGDPQARTPALMLKSWLRGPTLSSIRGHCTPGRPSAGTPHAAWFSPQHPSPPLPATLPPPPSLPKAEAESPLPARAEKGLETGFGASGEPQGPLPEPLPGPPRPEHLW